MIREEMLFKGQKFIEREDWSWLNDHDIAQLIGIHAKDFRFYFGSKHQYERDVLELYMNQHLLNAKTLLSCCFRRPANRVNSYLVYLTEEYTSKPKMIDMLSSPLTAGIQHQGISNQFLDRLTNLLADCLKESNDASRIDLAYLEPYSQGIIESHLRNLKKLNQEERHSISDVMRITR
jgi:hypothetical protein